MNKSYANLEVLNFYQKLPFNYYKNVDTAAGSITTQTGTPLGRVVPSRVRQHRKYEERGFEPGRSRPRAAS